MAKTKKNESKTVGSGTASSEASMASAAAVSQKPVFLEPVVEMPTLEAVEAAPTAEKIEPRQPRRSLSQRSGLVFPVARVKRYLKNKIVNKRIYVRAAIYCTAVLEYLIAEVVELAGNVAADLKKTRIKPRHIFLAIQSDEELNAFVGKCIISEGGVVPNILPVLLAKRTKRKQKVSIAADENVELPQQGTKIPFPQIAKKSKAKASPKAAAAAPKKKAEA